MYGYKTESGIMTIVPNEAKAIREMFAAYIGGNSIEKASRKIPHTPTTCGRMLEDERYAGAEGYPPIVDVESFCLAQQTRQDRYNPLKRGKRVQRMKARPVPVAFRFSEKPCNNRKLEPREEIEYLYGLVEGLTP